ncbi:4'-phosphopantetheinyl transferase superfamily protein [Kitasatospora sp. NPDC048538]|uniref:4'-phosphopantetheinyl transferase family protein n=1 Tax=unclassified Kitasatospora TaxID=2633591 RepID=UPI0033C2A0A1
MVSELWRLLDEDERARTAGADELLRRRFTVVRGAVRQLVGARLGRPAADVVWRRGRHGKPEPSDAGRLRVSWSASGPLAVLAVAEGRQLGVDVEGLLGGRAAGLIAARLFPGAEARYVAAAPTVAGRAARCTALWCRREACVKAYGGRLVQSFGLPVAGPSPLLLAEPRPLGRGPLRLLDVPVPGPFRAALAVRGDAPVHVNVQAWTMS